MHPAAMFESRRVLLAVPGVHLPRLCSRPKRRHGRHCQARDANPTPVGPKPTLIRSCATLILYHRFGTLCRVVSEKPTERRACPHSIFPAIPRKRGRSGEIFARGTRKISVMVRWEARRGPTAHVNGADGEGMRKCRRYSGREPRGRRLSPAATSVSH